MKEVCKLYNIDKTRTTAYHPQGNAQTERYNQTLINIVAMLVDKDEFDNWDEQLPIAVSAYNATEHATTGFTPNKLFFSREITHQLDFYLPQPQQEEQFATWDDYVRSLDKASQAAYDVARQAIGKAVKIQKRYYDRKKNLIAYNTGDAVLVKDHSQRETNTKKLADKYKGPYYVIDALSDIHFRLARNPDDKPKIVHHDNMKKMHLRGPVDLRWVYDMSVTESKKVAPATLEQVGKNLADLFRRLKAVENCVEQPSRIPRRKPQQRRKPKRDQEVSENLPPLPLAARTSPDATQPAAPERDKNSKPRTVLKKQNASKLPRPVRQAPAVTNSKKSSTKKPPNSTAPARSRSQLKPNLTTATRPDPPPRRSTRVRKPKLK